MALHRSPLSILAFAVGLFVSNSHNVRAETFSAPEVIIIPAGPFITGSDRAEREAAYQLDEKAYGHDATRRNQWYENEKKRATQTTPAFAITRTPITNADYAAFINDTSQPPPRVDKKTWDQYGLAPPYKRTLRFSWQDQMPPKNRENHPVVLVSHDDAFRYARWLSKKTGRIWRLPSEAEWEKAARGTEGNRFPWGNEFDATRLNSHDAGPFDTLPVGSFDRGASPFGLLGGSGQVFEWTETKADNDEFIVKGGSWDDKGCGVCRPAARHSRPAGLKHILIGFRLVCETCTKTDPNRRDSTGRTSLILAADKGNVNRVKELLAAGTNPDLVGNNQWSPLMLAAHKGHREIVALLLKAGADVNLANDHGQTALIMSRNYGHLEIEQMLLAAGAK